jgi:DNA-directed RNA polymerase subunit N (RpoN/RPB10)
MYPFIVCFCGMPIGHLYHAFVILRAAANEKMYENLDEVVIPELIGIASDTEAPVGHILDALCLTRECCRGHMLAQVEFKNML